jgi:hypothetical protein
VAGETLVGVEAGTKAVVRAFGDGLDFREPGQAILKERSFVGHKSLQGSAGTRRAAAHARIDWGSFGLTQSADACCQDQRNDSAKTLERNSLERHKE